MGIQILPPDVNICDTYFSVDGPNIRFGLAAIKSVGEGIVKTILDARAKDGPFKDICDFCERVPGANKRLLDALVQAGALDSFGKRRSQLLAVEDDAIARSQSARKDRNSGQLSLFSMMSQEDQDAIGLRYPDLPELDLKEKLAAEKNLLGFYLSGHPIDSARELVDTYQLDDLADLPELPNGTIFRCGAYLSACVKKVSKSTMKTFAILTLESREASIEAMLFARDLESIQKNAPEALEPGAVVFVEGEIDRSEDDSGKLRLKINKLVPVGKGPELYCGQMNLFIKEADATTEKLARFRDCCARHKGAARLVVCLLRDNGNCVFFRPHFTIKAVPKYLEQVRDLFGPDSIRLKGDKTRPQPKQRGNFYAGQYMPEE
jgi:DNA polymerase-3 subunit alpha